MAKFEDRLNDKLADIGDRITSRAKDNCPTGVYPKGSGIVGGRLRSSISWKTKDENGGYENHERGTAKDAVKVPKKKLSVKIGTSVEYAPFVEFGTYSMAGKASDRRAAPKGQKRKAFLRLALYENRNFIKKIMSL